MNTLLRQMPGLLAALALLLACYAAAARYLYPSLAGGWVDELVIYLLVWAMWLSGNLLVWDNAQVRADLLERLLRDSPWAGVLNRAVAILGLAFCLTMTWAGALVTLAAIELGERGDSTIALPLWVYYAGLPVGMALMGWRYAQQLRGVP